MAEILAIETIVSDPDARGGRPTIAGTSVTVSDIAAATYFKGRTPDELADDLNLTLAEAYAALAYYHAHRTAIDEQIRADRDRAEALLEMRERRAWIESLKPQIAAFCARWQIVEFALFGSVLTEDFRVDSDVDVLVTFASGEGWGLWEKAGAREELKGIFGREISLVTREGLEYARAPFRKSVLEAAEVIHVARENILATNA